MAEPRIAMFHPDFADEPDFDVRASGKYVAMLGPFLQTFPGLTVDDYWQLSFTEHNGLSAWLYVTGVLERGDEQPDDGGVREPRRPTPQSPAGAVAAPVPVTAG